MVIHFPNNLLITQQSHKHPKQWKWTFPYAALTVKMRKLFNISDDVQIDIVEDATLPLPPVPSNSIKLSLHTKLANAFYKAFSPVLDQCTCNKLQKLDKLRHTMKNRKGRPPSWDHKVDMSSDTLLSCCNLGISRVEFSFRIQHYWESCSKSS